MAKKAFEEREKKKKAPQREIQINLVLKIRKFKDLSIQILINEKAQIQ